jgi:FkbM family methyltransferase
MGRFREKKKLKRALCESVTARGEEDTWHGQLLDGSFRVVETRYGPLNVAANRDDLIGRFLSETGEWAFDEAAFAAATLHDGARVLDAGAFLGTFGLGIGLQRKLGMLCAVEANALVLPLLHANLRRNASSEFEVIGALLLGSEGAPRIGHANPTNLGSASFSKDAAGEECVPAPEATITLATLRERYGPFDLIKLDIEGMEREVMLGDAEHLSRGSTTLWIECNEHARSLDVLDLVLSWGLEVYYFAFPSHNPDNFRSLARPILPWAYEAGLLVAPGRPPVLDAERAAHGCILRPVASRAMLEEAMWLTPRWLPHELADADAPMLAAVASRALTGQERSSFLREGLGESGWGRLAAAQEELAYTDRTAFLRVIDEERRLRANAEARLADATSLALARLGLLGAERDRAADAEAAAKAAVAEAAVAEAAAQAAVANAEAAAQTAVAKAEAAVANAEAAAQVAVAKAEAAAKAAVANAEAQLASTNAQLAAIQMSLGWRLVARVNRFVARRPNLHRVLRRGRAVAGSLVGRR